MNKAIKHHTENNSQLSKDDGLSLPKGWEIKKLDEVCEIEYGTRVVRKRDGGSTYPVYGGGGATFFMDSFNRENCLVVARFAMSEKCTRFVKGKFFLNDSGLSVKPKDTKQILQDFLNWQFLHLNDFIYSLSRGAAQKNLNVPIFRKIDIHYPKSLPEQKRIVSILDRAFEAIDQAKANAEQNLKNAKELFQSKLQAIFDNGKLKIENGEWEERKFLDIVDYSKKPRGLKLDRPVPFVPMNFVPLEEKYINFNEYRDRVTSGTFVKNGDLLLAKITPSFENGKQGILNIKEKYAYATTEVIPFQGKKEIIETMYLFYFLKSKVRKMLEKKMEGATGRQRLPHKVLNDVNVPFPKSLETQKQIVTQLDQLQAETKKLEAIYQQKIDNLEELKKSILQKAFNGEL